jgi:hypothetical protein
MLALGNKEERVGREGKGRERRGGEQKTNCVASSQQPNYTDPRPPLVSEVNANFRGYRSVVRSAQRVP